LDNHHSSQVNSLVSSWFDQHNQDSWVSRSRSPDSQDHWVSRSNDLDSQNGQSLSRSSDLGNRSRTLDNHPNSQVNNLVSSRFNQRNLDSQGSLVSRGRSLISHHSS
jgi:predicted Zn-dependent protease